MAQHLDAGSRVKRLGMLVPSSNTVLEPETMKLLPRDGSITCHFSRLKVVKISAETVSRGQFDEQEVVASAALLADAEVDLIVWNGTAASWLGFDHDAALVAAIERRTNTRATTAVIGINAALHRMGARRIGLVTPYVAAIEAEIIRNYATLGISVTAAERLDLTDNRAFGAVPPAQIAAMIRTVGAQRPDAIVVMCTNLAGASLVEPSGKELGIPILDSVRTAFDHCRDILNGDDAA